MIRGYSKLSPLNAHKFSARYPGDGSHPGGPGMAEAVFSPRFRGRDHRLTDEARRGSSHRKRGVLKDEFMELK